MHNNKIRKYWNKCGRLNEQRTALLSEDSNRIFGNRKHVTTTAGQVTFLDKRQTSSTQYRRREKRKCENRCKRSNQMRFPVRRYCLLNMH